MGLVSFKNMREWVQRHGEVCTKCVAMEEDLQATTEKLKVRYIAEYDKVVLWAKQELTKEIQKLTQKKKPVENE
jgi:cell division inhibitor SulA